MKVSVILAAIMTAAVGATPTPPQMEKRQLSPPPPDCANVETYQLCANINSFTCYAPLPTAVFQCYLVCQGCCYAPDDPTICNLSGPSK